MAFENYDKCSLLLPMDGANNGTVFTDWSPNPKTVTHFDNTKTVTAQSKYYGSSAYFDGAGDYLDITDDPDLDISSVFTIAGWISFDQLISSGQYYLINRWDYTNNKRSYQITYDYNSGARRFSAGVSPNGFFDGNTKSVAYEINITPDQFYHIALTQDGATLRLFLDGDLVASTDSSVTPFATDIKLRLGATLDSTPSAFFKGNIQDIIMFDGVALWTSGFTPPARLIGELSNANALAPVEDETGTPAERTIIAVPRSYPTRAFGAQSDSNGDFTLRAPATECSVIALYEGSPIKNDLIHRVTPV